MLMPRAGRGGSTLPRRRADRPADAAVRRGICQRSCPVLGPASPRSWPSRPVSRHQVLADVHYAAGIRFFQARGTICTGSRRNLAGTDPPSVGRSCPDCHPTGWWPASATVQKGVPAVRSHAKRGALVRAFSSPLRGKQIPTDAAFNHHQEPLAGRKRTVKEETPDPPARAAPVPTPKKSALAERIPSPAPNTLDRPSSAARFVANDARSRHDQTRMTTAQGSYCEEPSP